MELIAKNGKWLTQKALQEGEQRGFWKKMSLAHTLTGDEFEEWTDEMKSAWEDEHKETEDIPESVWEEKP